MSRIQVAICVACLLLAAGAVWWKFGQPVEQNPSPPDPPGGPPAKQFIYRSWPLQWSDFVSSRRPRGTGWVHLPAVPEVPRFRSGIDPYQQGFVQPEVCGQCHQEIWDSFQQNAHYRTSSQPTAENILGRFDEPHGKLATRDPHVHFEMQADDQGSYQTVTVQRPGTPFKHRQRFDLVTGSGNHGQTYMYWHGDHLYQLPISYMTELGGWSNSPGRYFDGTADFARAIGDRCLDCHLTFAAKAPASFNQYDRENYMLGVTCVRCHGRGNQHVEYHRKNPAATTARHIQNPGKLSQQRANEVCAQCHSGVGRLLKAAFTYQPGQPLDQYLAIELADDHPRNDDPHSANQLARLKKSRCYTASEKMTCAMCHDPHRQQRGNTALFSQRCASCHQSDQCGLETQHGAWLHDRCVVCHMPSRRDSLVSVPTPRRTVTPLLRDHHIAVWPEASPAGLGKAAEGGPAVAPSASGRCSLYQGDSDAEDVVFGDGVGGADGYRPGARSRYAQRKSAARRDRFSRPFRAG